MYLKKQSNTNFVYIKNEELIININDISSVKKYKYTTEHPYIQVRLKNNDYYDISMDMHEFWELIKK